jgi:pantoate--beta-alanine ligase
MRIIDTVAGMQQQARDWKQAGEQIAFVPTMGNLHTGHIALVKAARKLAQRCVVSIFVNPKQFGPNEDFATYPRSFAADCAQLEAEGVDCVFAPSSEAMYPAGKDACTSITVPGLSDLLEGEHRPGFFTGVATIVCKLFNCVQPDVAVFGEKDYQQCFIVRRMVRDLDLAIEIVSQPTVREADGLALSSRNTYLDAEQRQRAAGLYRCLKKLVAAVHQHTDIGFAVIHASRELEQQGFEVDYVVVRRQTDLHVPVYNDTALVALAAVHLGATRLIDNLPFILERPESGIIAGQS